MSYWKRPPWRHFVSETGPEIGAIQVLAEALPLFDMS